MDKNTAWKTYYKVTKNLADLSRLFLEYDLPDKAKDMYKIYDLFEENFLAAINSLSYDKENTLED